MMGFSLAAERELHFKIDGEKGVFSSSSHPLYHEGLFGRRTGPQKLEKAK